jgi:hypothetical protein
MSNKFQNTSNYRRYAYGKIPSLLFSYLNLEFEIYLFFVICHLRFSAPENSGTEFKYLGTKCSRNPEG